MYSNGCSGSGSETYYYGVPCSSSRTQSYHFLSATIITAIFPLFINIWHVLEMSNAYMQIKILNKITNASHAVSESPKAIGKIIIKYHTTTIGNFESESENEITAKTWSERGLSAHAHNALCEEGARCAQNEMNFKLICTKMVCNQVSISYEK